MKLTVPFWICHKQASRAQILDKATEYIQYMRRKNHTHQQDIDDLKRQNALLEQQGISEEQGPLVFWASFDVHSSVHVLFSSRSGKGEGLQSAPGRLSVVRQQTVHQLQRNCRVGIWRGLRPELRVRSRRAFQQEEAARGVQLEDPRALKSWPGSLQQGIKSETEHCRGWPPPCYFNRAATFIILLISGSEIATSLSYHHDCLHSQEVSKVEVAALVQWKSFCFCPPSSLFFPLFFQFPPSVFTI